MHTPQDIPAPHRLDGAGAETLAHQLDSAIRAGNYQIRLSLRETGFLSSAGIRVLLTYHRQLAQLGGALAIQDAGETIRATFELSGLTALLNAPAAPAAPPTSAAPARRTLTPALQIITEHLGAYSLAAACAGDPDQLANPPADVPPLARLALTDDFYGVGLGAFGEPADCRPRIGELLCAAGMAVCRAADSKVPDYMISSPRLQPAVQALYAAGFTGRFAAFSRFRPGADTADVTLTGLLQSIMTEHAWPAMGFAMIAEIGGLIGATLTRVPAAGAGGGFFDYPGLRNRLEFTAEPEYGRDLAAAAGVAFLGAQPPAAWRPFIRPYGDDGRLFTHIHAAVFTYRALPAGRPEFATPFRELLEQSQLRAVLHLINDRRPATGLGESRFRHGMIWSGPIP